jgi:peptide/nickel transport system permease protein
MTTAVTGATGNVGTLPGLAGPARRPGASWRRTRVLLGSAGARFGALMMLLVAVSALAPGLVAPTDPNEQQLLARFTRPVSRTALGTLAVLGTDQLGRDILSRVIHGARTSVLIGLAAVVVAGTVGTGLGLLAGVRGGLTDHVIMRLADMQFAFPFILLAITVIGILGASIRNIVLVVGLSNWVCYARIVRGETLAVREKTYVDAARSLGSPLPRIVSRHILPNVSASLIVVATFGVAGAILTEAGLSFLGLGVPLHIPSWGGMLAEGRQYVDTRYWLALFPGAALFLTVMAINLLGDALRDALDPYLQARQSRSSVDQL